MRVPVLILRTLTLAFGVHEQLSAPGLVRENDGFFNTATSLSLPFFGAAPADNAIVVGFNHSTDAGAAAIESLGTIYT